MVETVRHDCRLLGDRAAESTPRPDAAIRAELGLLAVSTSDRGERSRRLFGKLRKSQGSSRFDDLLDGILALAHEGDPVGARLLAALLDRSTVADRLLPSLGGLTSARRYSLLLRDDPRATNQFGGTWLKRLKALVALSEPAADTPDNASAADSDPWPRLRRDLSASLEVLRTAAEPDNAAGRVACELLRLEVDALEERASRLAGIVDPFHVVGIQRLLPILSDLDARIRDARHLISCLESGDREAVFCRPESRAVEVMEEVEYRKLLQAVGESGSAALLHRLLRAREENPEPLARIAVVIAGLRRLGDRLAASGTPNSCTDLPGAAGLALGAAAPDCAELLLTEKEVVVVTAALAESSAAEDPVEAGVPGLQSLAVEGNLLRLRIDADVAAAHEWPHDLPASEGDLPAVEASADPDAESADDDFGATEAKRLVMNNLQSMSILLSLLRNPKITAVPGLVAEVATRTRNPQVIATIASDRALYTGFANRDVPLACLRNPSNVSVKILRKFVHVKFVAKIDLKRMAQDRAGVRRELRREIDLYLETLA